MPQGYDVFAISNWFLYHVDNVSNKKLQKLLYYAYAWHLTLLNETVGELSNRLFEQQCEAWVHGPVVPIVYHHFKDNYFFDIPKGDLQDNSGSFDEDVLDILQQVKDVYGGYNGNELENISHQETPWINARLGCSLDESCTAIIDDKDIYEFYISRAVP